MATGRPRVRVPAEPSLPPLGRSDPLPVTAHVQTGPSVQDLGSAGPAAGAEQPEPLLVLSSLCSAKAERLRPRTPGVPPEGVA